MSLLSAAVLQFLITQTRDEVSKTRRDYLSRWRRRDLREFFFPPTKDLQNVSDVSPLLGCEMGYALHISGSLYHRLGKTSWQDVYWYCITLGAQILAGGGSDKEESVLKPTSYKSYPIILLLGKNPEIGC